MFKQPNPEALAVQLRNCIQKGKSPKLLFYEFMSSGSMEGNFLAGKILENKQVLRVITSPQGRIWVKRNIDDFLNYLELLSR